MPRAKPATVAASSDFPGGGHLAHPPPSLHTHLKPEPHWVRPAFRPSLGASYSAPLLWPAWGDTAAMGASSLGPWGKPAANRRGLGLAGGRSPGLGAGQSRVFLSCPVPTVSALARSTMPLPAAPGPPSPSRGLSLRSLG